MSFSLCRRFQDILRRRPKTVEFRQHPDAIVDLEGLPGDNEPRDMTQIYAKISGVLANAGIMWCLAGDQAWEYYNVPFAISVSNLWAVQSFDKLHPLELQEQEIVVPLSQVDSAIDVFTSMPDFCIPFRPRHYPTPVKHFRRFKITGVNLYFLIIPDTYYSLSPLGDEKFVTPQPAPFPVLYLKYYVGGMGRLGKEYRVVLEYLVDSMDLDEVWCTRNLNPANPGCQLILDLAQLKKERLGKHPKYEGNITTLIANKSQLDTALAIRGRDHPSSSKFALVF
jgi:hypothetical protein